MAGDISSSDPNRGITPRDAQFVLDHRSEGVFKFDSAKGVATLTVNVKDSHGADKPVTVTVHGVKSRVMAQTKITEALMQKITQVAARHHPSPAARHPSTPLKTSAGRDVSHVTPKKAEATPKRVEATPLKESPRTPLSESPRHRTGHVFREIHQTPKRLGDISSSKGSVERFKPPLQSSPDIASSPLRTPKIPIAHSGGISSSGGGMTRLESSGELVRSRGAAFKSTPLQPLGSGMDKVFYLPPKPRTGVHMGFLDTSNDVKVAELSTYRKLEGALRGSGVRIPQVMDDAKRAGPLVVKKKTGNVETGKGFWIECIPNMRNFKPITAALMATGGRDNNPIRIYNRLIKEGKVEEAATLKRDLIAIRDNVRKIAPIVGELTLGINNETGQVYLVDVAPTGGQTAIDQVDQIERGLRNLCDGLR